MIEALDSAIKIDRDVETFELVCGITNRWLSCSVDGVIDLNVDGDIHSTLIEIKTFSALSSSEEAEAFANDFSKLNRCTFGDNIFQKGIKTILYRVQVLHHAVVLKAKYVLFIAVGKNSITYMLLISFTDD